MSHFAEIKDGKVVRVVVCDSLEWLEKRLGGEWVQTSYTGSIRKNYAGVGYAYDKVKDEFVPPAGRFTEAPKMQGNSPA